MNNMKAARIAVSASRCDSAITRKSRMSRGRAVALPQHRPPNYVPGNYASARPISPVVARRARNIRKRNKAKLKHEGITSRWAIRFDSLSTDC